MSPLTPTPELSVAPILMGLGGGLALFLFGMEQMTGGLKSVAGGGMRALLKRLTRNRFLAMLTGAFVTAVIQSSSITTVLVVGFISAGLMTLSQSVGVIFGANIGTTITAQIIAFKVTEYALVLIASGFAASFFSRRERTRNVGAMVMGLGLVFFGMSLMSDATGPLRSYAPFVDGMQKMGQPLLGIGAAALFTALVQSSSATTGVVIVLASQGFITLEAGIALALGANIGTCATAGLAAVDKPRTAMQAVAIHILFNVVGVLIWIPFIPDLADLVRQISPTATELAGKERLAAEVPRQIANAHTVFNLANALIMIGFTGSIARFVQWLLPDRPTAAERARPRYLEEIYLLTPALAIDRLRMEIGHLGELARGILASARKDRSSPLLGPVVAEAAEDLRALYGEIADYARRLLSRGVTESEALEIETVLEVANHLHNIGDTLSINIHAISSRFEERGLAASDETRDAFHDLFLTVEEIVGEAVWAFSVQDVALASRIIERKSAVYGLARDIERRLASRLRTGDTRQLEKYRLESEALELTKRIFYFAKRIAKKVSAEASDDESPPPWAARPTGA